MKKTLFILSLLLSAVCWADDVNSDYWAATDALGRKVGRYDELHPDKQVILFYWTWHEWDDPAATEIRNITDIVRAHPEAMQDVSHPAWQPQPGHFWWDEPLFGYYRTTDRWVLRKHAELLADAGVDVIFFDNTNGTFTFKDSYVHIFEVFEEALNDGVNVPKISFLLPFGDNDSANTQVRSLYQDIFQRGKYQKLWFYFDGKPMLMCNRDFIKTNDTLGKEIRNYFTFRAPQASYQTTPIIKDQWGWLSTYKQTRYKKTGESGVEQITVGVAVNHDYVTHQLSAMNGDNIIGRTYTSKGIDTRENAVKYGANFAEQFEYAISVDPKVIFITGWNEWIAGRYDVWCGVKNAFPDEFNDEFSRDIEPSKGNLRDNYYYQMVYYIRKFKGCEELPVYSSSDSINLKSALAPQWEKAEASYVAYPNNTADRDAKGYGSYYYTDNSGRNDITGAKIAKDKDNIYFMVECRDDITPYTDKNWMNLYIDVTDETGWETFDYVVGKKPADAEHAYLQKFTGSGYETEDAVPVQYSLDGKYLVIAVPKTAIGVKDSDKICFKWTDNVQDEDGSGEFKGEILDFYRTGDAAPGGRFKYVYTFTQNASGPEQTTAAVTDGESQTSVSTDVKETGAAEADGKSNAGVIVIVICAVVIAASVAVIVIMIFKKKK